MREHRRENRKDTRIQLDDPLKVVMCSIGAQVRYELLTRDVSQNGFFLEFESPGRFPFNKASIMEVWMELDDTSMVFFNGKMARVVRPGDPMEAETGAGIAIRIVQIDKENDRKLRAFVDQKIRESSGKSPDIAS